MKAKICFFVKDIYEYGGIPKVVSKTCSILSKDDKYEVCILSLFKSNKSTPYFIEENIKIYNIDNEHKSLYKMFYRYKKNIRAELCNIEPDILIISGIGYFNLLNKSITKDMRCKLKLIGWEHNCFGDWKTGGFAWQGYKNLKTFDNLIVLTESNKKAYSDCFDSDKINIIPNPIDTVNEFSKYNQRSKKIISAGELIKRKGFDQIPYIYDYIFDLYPDWQWEIYGTGIETKELEKIIEQKNMSNNVLIKGFTENLHSKMEDSAIFVSTARSEAFGMVLIEAQNCNLPVISFKAQGPNEIVSNNINGYLLDQGDLKGMAMKLIELMQNTEKRIEFSNNAKINFTKYSDKNILSKWKKVFDDL